jgi:hypothetical protein
MSFRLVTLLSVLLGLAGESSAQQAACQLEIPVGVISVTGDVFRGLAAEDFSGNAQKKTVAVKSLTYDEGPRRVLFVVDNNKKLSADSRKAEAEMIQIMVAAGRPEDTFALLPTRGPGQEVKFTSDRTAITRAFNQDGETKRGKELGVLDGVMDGIEWFGAPQAGDAIVLIAADTEGNRKANAKLVSKALEEHHIRMFGLALGPVATKNSMAGGSMTSTTSQGLAWTTPGVGDFVYNTGDDHFYPLTTNSGGLVLAAMNANPRRSYNMADTRVVQDVRQKARSISKMIIAFYRMQIEPPHLAHPEDWNLDVAESIRKHSQPMFVLYPHALGPC